MQLSTLLSVAISLLGVSASPVPQSSYSGATVATVDGTQSNPAVVAQMLNTTNYYRYLHGGAPVTWNQSVADWAQSNMGKCIFQHSSSPYGENLAGETGSTDPNADVMSEIGMWYAEGNNFDYSTPSYSHFTALIWNSVTSIGCARVYCDPVKNSDGSNGFSGWFLECDYFPTANFASDAEFKANVLPPKNSGAGYKDATPSGSVIPGYGSASTAVPDTPKSSSKAAAYTSTVPASPQPTSRSAVSVSTSVEPTSSAHATRVYTKHSSAQPTAAASSYEPSISPSAAATSADASSFSAGGATSAAASTTEPTAAPSESPESSPVPDQSSPASRTWGHYRGRPTGSWGSGNGNWALPQ